MADLALCFPACLRRDECHSPDAPCRQTPEPAVADIPSEVYEAAAAAMLPHVEAEDVFEWHPCTDKPACPALAGQPCTCSGRPYPSPAVRAALVVVWQMAQQAKAAEILGIVRDQLDRPANPDTRESILARLERDLRAKVAADIRQYAADEIRLQSSWLWYQLGETQLEQIADRFADRVARGRTDA